MLHIYEVFHSNILFIYVLTSILVIIFSLRSETHDRQYFNNNWHKGTHNKIKKTSTLMRNSILYSNISLQSLSL
jgi:adenine specific DNA methylase Mod